MGHTLNGSSEAQVVAQHVEFFDLAGAHTMHCIKMSLKMSVVGSWIEIDLSLIGPRA